MSKPNSQVIATSHINSTLVPDYPLMKLELRKVITFFAESSNELFNLLIPYRALFDLQKPV